MRFFLLQKYLKKIQSHKLRGSDRMEDTITVNCKELDDAIEKANRLVELLREAQQIIDSLSGKSSRPSLREPLMIAIETIRQECETRAQSYGGTCQGSPWERIAKGNSAD